MPSDPYADLGKFLTAYEAERLAVVLAGGGTTTRALREINSTRRPDATRLLKGAALGRDRVDETLAILQAIAGARSVRTIVTPVWTLPGPESKTGRLTSEVLRLIDDARMSVVCSSFNFAKRSMMWTSLRNASERPGVTVAVYLDARVSSSQDVANQLPRAAIYRSRTPENGQRVNHAKFVIIDRTIVLSTSANFSQQAERTNIEFGLLVEDSALASAVEETMRNQQERIYQLVPPSAP